MTGGRSWWRRSLVGGVVVVLAIGALSSLLSVNAFPVVSNDSVLYIEHSLDLTRGGWVAYGFRQVGYPLSLAGARWAANGLGAEPMLAMAVLQRLLLLAAAGLAVWLLRWWSLPLLVFLISGSTIAYSNFLLTEGVGLPVGLLTALATIAYVRAIGDAPTARPRTSVMAVAVSATLGAAVLYMLRFTYGVFAAVPIVILISSWRSSYRRFSLILMGVFVAAMFAFTFALAAENARELGVASPSVGGEPTHYYYAWTQVFTVHPENRQDPELAEYYDDGVVHHFSRQVRSLGLSYRETVHLYDQEIESMLKAAGMSVVGSRLSSAAWSLVGGRLHDIEGAVDKVLASTRTNVEQVIYLNQYAARNGPVAFVAAYNDSQLAEAVITNPIGARIPIPDGQTLAVIMVPLALFTMLAGLFSPTLRPLSLLGLLIVFGAAVGFGWVRADNYRFLITSSAVGIAAATAVADSAYRRWRGMPPSSAGIDLGGGAHA